MPKATLQCDFCHCELRKADAQFVDDTTFAFQARLPAGVLPGTYCAACFERQVRSELESYCEKMERAKNVNIFYRSQSKESRFVRRIEKPVRVENCPDREEVILRLAFQAVESGHNALVDVDLSSVKVRMAGWQSSRWSGLAIPANIEERALQRRFRGSPN